MKSNSNWPVATPRNNTLQIWSFGSQILSGMNPKPLILLMRGITKNMANPAAGGTVVLEDIDFRGHFCHPECAAFSRYVHLYTQAAHRRGADPNIGPRLPQ